MTVLVPISDNQQQLPLAVAGLLQGPHVAVFEDKLTGRTYISVAVPREVLDPPADLAGLPFG